MRSIPTLPSFVVLGNARAKLCKPHLFSRLLARPCRQRVLEGNYRRRRKKGLGLPVHFLLASDSIIVLPASLYSGRGSTCQLQPLNPVSIFFPTLADLVLSYVCIPEKYLHRLARGSSSEVPSPSSMDPFLQAQRHHAVKWHPSLNSLGPSFARLILQASQF